MKCPQVQDRLSAFQDGELQPQEKERVSKHLESCSACRERYKEMEKAWQALGDLKEILPEPGFYGQLVEKINESNEARFPFRFQWISQLFSSPWLASALLVAGIFLGTFLGNILVKSELFPIQQNQAADPQAASEALSLKAFDPMPPGTLGDKYMRMASNEGGKRR
jgi:anti-sigma factor RsiW